ncbi:MAG: general secretion pathway protein GspB [Gammaproteobacteria bacterium]
MSILSDAWRRSRGEEDAVSRALGAPPLPGGHSGGRLLPWVLCLCAVLVIAVVGLGVYVWRSAAVRPAVSAHQTPGVKSRMMPGPSPATALLGATPQPLGEVHRQPAKPVGTVKQESGVSGGGGPADVGQREKTQAPGAVGARATQTVPDAVRAALPPLAVTVHVWNPRPSSRFIIVDGHVYHEGDTLGPQLRLVAITQSGQIVDFRGYLITLTGQ